ncbi:MAG: pterin-4-alpha-carbinolamine dehydratase [Flavobacteriales bacterium]|nr:pterin-4-alpha-carbinolamine dehydratase [Flavobacteriales bacterium]
MTWITTKKALKKKFKFKSFNESIKFLNEIAEISEKLNHHPEIIVKFDEVWLKLQTHDAGCVVTKKDYNFAKIVDEIRK